MYSQKRIIFIIVVSIVIILIYKKTKMSVTALEALERRRTVRNYDPNYQIPKDQIEKIMALAQHSPTACDFQGQDYLVVTNKEKLKKIEKIVIDNLPDDNFKKHFVERKERHGVSNVVTCDATTVVFIYKNERAAEDWIKIDTGIATMSIIVAAQAYGIESMCLGVVVMGKAKNQIEELLGLKKDSLVLGVALGKPLGKPTLPKKEIKCKVSYDA